MCCVHRQALELIELIGYLLTFDRHHDPYHRHYQSHQKQLQRCAVAVAVDDGAVRPLEIVGIDAVDERRVASWPHVERMFAAAENRLDKWWLDGRKEQEQHDWCGALDCCPSLQTCSGCVL